MMAVPRLRPETGTIISEFIRERFASSGCRGCVLGLSGGLDSALVLKLSSIALGSDRVLPVFLPYGELSSPDRDLASMSARDAGCDLREHDISPLIEAFPFELGRSANANLQARMRMAVLYAIANEEDLLVLGTSNKTEIMLGYFTKHGDGGSDICPIGDLYKTQVRALASELGVPRPLIDRVPTAGLIPGQTDEGDIGLPYPLIDRVVIGYLTGYAPRKVFDMMEGELEDDASGGPGGLTLDSVERIFSMIEGSRHKRDPLIIPKVGAWTVGIDLRERW